jgi:erythromycin esterase
VGNPEAFVVDRWLHGGDGDVAGAQRQLTWSMGLCEEMADLLQWLRARGHVAFYGIDIPGSMGSLLPALDPLTAYLDEVEPTLRPLLDRVRTLAARYADPNANDAQRRYAALAAAERDTLTALLSDVEGRFDAQRVAYASRAGEDAYEVAHRHLRAAVALDRVLRLYHALFGGDSSGAGANVRDAAMAEMVHWILAREEKLVLLAHNGHVQRTPLLLPALEELSGSSPVGHHLATALGSDYVTVGTTFGEGEIMGASYQRDGGVLRLATAPTTVGPPPEGTIDRLLAGEPDGRPFAVDLRALGAADTVRVDACTGIRSMDSVVRAEPRRAFDVLVHVPELTLWRATATPPVPHVDVSPPGLSTPPAAVSPPVGAGPS